MRVAVIGAGPAGITTAYELAKAGVEVEVFEASPYVGGLARSFELWGQLVDVGPHRFFSNDARVNRAWLEVAGRDYRMVDRLTRIFYDGKFYDYPLRAKNALWNMGVLRSSSCMLSFLREQVRPRRDHPETFEDWIVGRFGRRLFEMFFKSYSEKLWGISCEQLDADFAKQRIKKFSLGQALISALGFSRGKHKTLVSQFAYPTGGTGMIYERMASVVRARGGRIHLRSPVQGLICEAGRITGLRLHDGRAEGFTHVVSTMPLTLMARTLGTLPEAVEAALGRLVYRNTIIVYLQVAGTGLFPDQWLYIQSPELALGRVTNFRNWVPELHRGAESSILALEYWCGDDDALWHQPEHELIEFASKEIQRTGLLRGSSVLAGHMVRVHRSYPVYDMGYKERLALVVDHLRGYRGLTAIGRYGAFKYNNQDHSILMGLLAAENLIRGSRHDLWAVNTDYENYHESGVILEEGLMCQKQAG